MILRLFPVLVTLLVKAGKDTEAQLHLHRRLHWLLNVLFVFSRVGSEVCEEWVGRRSGEEAMVVALIYLCSSIG